MKNRRSFKLPELKKKEAVDIILQNQLLFPSSISNIKDYIQFIITKLGYVQIDTISVTERSVNHIIWTRAGNFDRNLINELYTESKIFEYWSHAAAILPIKDFRYSLIFKRYYRSKYGSFRKRNKRLIKYVTDRIISEGPLMSKDFDDKKTGTSGWWNRKPSKEALEFLFFSGDLMVKERKNFQKVYDLTERILPDDIDSSIPGNDEYIRHLILSSVNSNGLISKNEITYLRRIDRKALESVFNELIEKNIICEIIVKGIEDQSYFTFPDSLNNVHSKKSGLKILSPFDNLIIQRKRIKYLFDFDFQMECYLPQTKRKYGYFAMPVLYNNKFIGRIDLKSDRKNNSMIVNNFYPENESSINKLPLNKFRKVLKDYAEFTGCENITGLNF